MKQDDTLQLLQARERDLKILKSADHQDTIIANFKKSQDYELEIKGQAVPFLDKGIVHAIRQLHQFVLGKKLLLDVYENNFDAEECRKWVNFVPFQEEELAALRALDTKKGLPEWFRLSPSILTFGNFWKLPQKWRLRKAKCQWLPLQSLRNLIHLQLLLLSFSPSYLRKRSIGYVL